MALSARDVAVDAEYALPMRSRVVPLALVVVVVLTMAACDTSPPTFTVPLDAAFVVGAQIEPSDSNGEEEAYTWDIPRRLTWLAADDDRACRMRYDLLLIYAGSEPGVLLDNSRRTQLDLLTNDYDGSYGGGSGSTDGWRAVARDCAGNTATSEYGLASRVWQEDGFSPFTAPLDPPIEWTGSWAVQTGPWTSGGQQRFTSSPGASVSFTWDHYVDGQHVGLVMPKGPGRGSAAVFVDDVLVGTIDTNAPANDNRRIVFDHAMPAGSHTLSIVNLATVGHPRIDIDAFLL
jgi:hypothetical protein